VIVAAPARPAVLGGAIAAVACDLPTVGELADAARGSRPLAARVILPHRMPEVEARRWIVIGRVQGVGYRYFARQAAQALGVRGWIRNLPDGTCEVQVAATAETLQRFKDELLRGPRGSRVEDVDEERLVQVPTWQSFQIVF
jgi:acylphosphatase